jgi:hypothetical protein
VTTAQEGCFKQEKVWKVNELVAQLIVRIADRNFVADREQEPKFPRELRSLNLLGIRDLNAQPGAAADFRKVVLDWYAANRNRTQADRKIADVSDVWFRNRFDAIIWLGGNRVKGGRAPIAARVDAHYADEKRSPNTTARAEMSHCALALGQIGDKSSLGQVQRVCEDIVYWLDLAYQPAPPVRWSADSALNEDLFRAYRRLALLGKKDDALKELTRLRDAYGVAMEADTKKDFEKRLTEAKDW